LLEARAWGENDCHVYELREWDMPDSWIFSERIALTWTNEMPQRPQEAATRESHATLTFVGRFFSQGNISSHCQSTCAMPPLLHHELDGAVSTRMATAAHVPPARAGVRGQIVFSMAFLMRKITRETCFLKR